MKITIIDAQINNLVFHQRFSLPLLLSLNDGKVQYPERFDILREKLAYHLPV